MSSLSDQAEDDLRFTGQASAEYSNTAPPLQQYSSHSIDLDSVGTLFPSSKGSYETNVEISDDEAFMTQPPEESTTPANHTSWIYDSPSGGRSGNSPPTPRLTPIRGLPFLPYSEYPEFERQRAAKKKCNVGFDPYRSPLKDTPRASPAATACTSIEPNSDSEDSFLHRDHPRHIFSDGHTPSQGSADSEANKENETRNGMSRQYFESEGQSYFSEDSHSGSDAPGHMALSLSDPWHASNLAAPRDRA